MRTPTLLAVAMAGMLGTAAFAQTAPAPAPVAPPAAPSATQTESAVQPPMGGPGGRMGPMHGMMHGQMGNGPGMGGPGIGGPGIPGGPDGMMGMHERMQAMHGRMHDGMPGMHRQGMHGHFNPRTFALIVPQADRNLSADDVKKIAEGFLLWNGNHTWKVVDVAPVADKGIGFSLATPDGTVIAKFAMDPKTGRVTRLG